MPIVFFRHIWSTVSNIIFVTLAALAALSLFQSAFFHVNMAFMVHPTQLVGVTVHVYALFTKLKQKSVKIECCGMYSTTSCCLFPTHLRVATLITTEQLQKIFFCLFVSCRFPLGPIAVWFAKFDGWNPSPCRHLVPPPSLYHLGVGLGFRANAGHELAAAARPLRL